MLDIINYLTKQGLATNKELFADLNEACSGIPKINYDQSCSDLNCNKCIELCPTQAISLTNDLDNKISPNLNLAKCIGCSLCIENCPDMVFVKNLRTKTAVTQIEDLVISKEKSIANANIQPILNKNFRPLFKKSLSVRVVSTGCNACDLEINATLNPMFDLERFGINIVASPRMADALLVTGSSVYVNDTYTGYTIMQASQASLSAGVSGLGGVFKLDTAGPLTIYAQVDQGGVVTPGVVSAQIIAIQTFSGFGIYNDASIQSNDFIFLTASQNGYIAEPTTGALMMAPNIALVSGGGAIGAGGRLLLNSGIVAASTQGLNNFVNIYDEASQSGINGGQAGSSFTFNTNGNLNVYGSIATGAGSNANGGAINLSANGTVNIGTSTGVSLTTNNGPIIVQNNNTIAGTIIFAKNSFVYTNTPANIAGYVVFNIGAYTQANTSNPNPPNISVQASGGASVFFGNNGISAPASGNTLNAKGQSIVFNTGSLGANAITLNGNVSITADPPVVNSGLVTIQNNLTLTNNFSQPVNTTNTLVNNPIQANVLDNNQAGLLLNNYTTNQVSQSNAIIYNNNDTDNNDIVNNTSFIRPIAYHHIEYGINANGLKQERGLPLATNNHSLTHGSAIIVASQELTVVLGKIKPVTLLLKRGAIVLAIANSGIVSVYNLHDNHKDSVIVKSGDRKIILNPGRHLTVLAANYLTDFANVNQVNNIGYRDFNTNISNGLVTYVSDFSIPSAINAIKPLRAMFKSKDCQIRNLANQLLKTSCIVTQSSCGKDIYNQAVKPKLTALK